MSFSQDAGYTPNTVSTLMSLVRDGINEQFGTDYDEDTFLGTNFYKYFYALIQRLQEQEVKTSEIVLNLQQYFVTTNEMIVRPNTTHPGLLDFLTEAGYTASTKAPEVGDAGKLYVCVDLDDADPDYATDKTAVCTILKNCVAAGIITQGDESEFITIENNQSFEFSFNLPTRIPILLKLTIALSDNNQDVILSDDDVKALLLANINSKYRLGLDFEPQRYFSVADAPWAKTVLLEYSIDDGSPSYLSTVASLNYDDLYEFDLADITIVNT